MARPRIDPSDPERSFYVTVALPPRRFDKLYVKSRQEKTTIPELIRRALLLAEFADGDDERKK